MRWGDEVIRKVIIAGDDITTDVAISAAWHMWLA
jgi:hypothetical protein